MSRRCRYRQNDRRKSPIATNNKNGNGGRKNGGHAWGPQNPHPLSTRKAELVWERATPKLPSRAPRFEATR